MPEADPPLAENCRFPSPDAKRSLGKGSLRDLTTRHSPPKAGKRYKKKFLARTSFLKIFDKKSSEIVKDAPLMILGKDAFIHNVNS